MRLSKQFYLYACVVVALLIAGAVAYRLLGAPKIQQVKYEFAKVAVALDDLTIGIEKNYGLIVGLGVKAENSSQPVSPQSDSKPSHLKKEVEMIVYLNAEQTKEIEVDGQIQQEVVESLVTKPIEYIKAGMQDIDAVHVRLRLLNPSVIENNQKLKKEMQQYRKLIRDYENTQSTKTATI